MSTRKNSYNSDAPSDKPVRKRIRDNHNELERVRRNNQKAQLEALRMALPFQDMDEKASMVSIFIRAREYIGMLEQRIMELQGGVGQPIEYPVTIPVILPKVQLPSSPLHHPHAMAHMPSVPSSPTFARRREPSISPDHIQVHHGVSFYNPGFMTNNNSSGSSIEVSALITPMSSPISRKPPSPVSESILNADILRNFVSDNFLNKGLPTHRLSAEEENNFLKNFHERRGSSLLMPLEDETVMIQKRESLSALFSGLLPEFIDSSVINSGDEIKCHKCQKGMCSMIMIDCDRCHKWYHIKCAEIDSDAIPTNWTCC
jgi:hypothetical protein